MGMVLAHATACCIGLGCRGPGVSGADLIGHGICDFCHELVQQTQFVIVDCSIGAVNPLKHCGAWLGGFNLAEENGFWSRAEKTPDDAGCIDDIHHSLGHHADGACGILESDEMNEVSKSI
jgi:hypothetical protein